MTELEIPDLHKWVYCPISYSIFNFPVLAMDGNIYEHDFIFRWFDECRKKEYTQITSPLTKEVLHDDQLCVCHLARQMTEAYLEKFPDKKDQQYESNFNMNIFVSYFHHNHKMIYPYLKSVGMINIHKLTYNQLRRCVSILDENNPLCASQIWDTFFGKISDFEEDFDAVTDDNWSGETIVYYQEHSEHSDTDIPELIENEDETEDPGQVQHEMEILHEEQMIEEFQNQELEQSEQNHDQDLETESEQDLEQELEQELEQSEQNHDQDLETESESEQEHDQDLETETETESETESEQEHDQEQENESEPGLDEHSGNINIQRRIAMGNRNNRDDNPRKTMHDSRNNHLNDSYYKDLEKKYSKTFLGCILNYGNQKIVQHFLKYFPCLLTEGSETKREYYSDLLEYLLGLQRVIHPNVYQTLIEKGVPYAIANIKKDKSIVFKIFKTFNRPFSVYQNFILWLLNRDDIFKKIEGLEDDSIENDLFRYINETCEPRVIRKAWENYSKHGVLESIKQTVYLRNMYLEGICYRSSSCFVSSPVSSEKSEKDIKIIPYKYFFDLCTNLSAYNIWYHKEWTYSIHYFEIVKKYLFQLGFIPTEILNMKCMYPSKLLTECLEKLPVKCLYPKRAEMDLTENMIMNDFVLPPTMMKDTIYSDKIFLENYFDKMVKVNGGGAFVDNQQTQKEEDEQFIKLYHKKTWCLNPNTPGGKYVISQRVGSIQWIFNIQRNISRYLNQNTSLNIFNYDILSNEKISFSLYKIIEQYLKSNLVTESEEIQKTEEDNDMDAITEKIEFLCLEAVCEEAEYEKAYVEESEEEEYEKADDHECDMEEGEIKEKKIKIDNYTDLVKTVLKEQPNKKKIPFIQPFPKMTPFGWMIYNYGTNEIIAFMESQKPAVNTLEFTGLYHAYPIHLILKYHSHSSTLLRSFMEYAKDAMDIMQPTSHGWYPLHYACRYAPGLVSELLEYMDDEENDNYPHGINAILEITVENSRKKLRLTALDILNLNQKNQYYEKNLALMLDMDAKSGYEIYTDA